MAMHEGTHVDRPRRLATYMHPWPLTLSHESTTQWVVLVDNASEGRRYETMGTVTKGRPLEGAEHTTQIACRLPDSMLVMLDAWRAERTQPGLTITRSDALRMILAATLDRTTGR